MIAVIYETDGTVTAVDNVNYINVGDDFLFITSRKDGAFFGTFDDQIKGVYRCDYVRKIELLEEKKKEG